MHDEAVHADLHTHTHYSDGVLAPDALVRRAAERGVQVLAVTDHDTTAGLDEAKAAVRGHDVQLVNGAELSVVANGESVHLLGYGVEIAWFVVGISAGIMSAIYYRRYRSEKWHSIEISESVA